MFIFLFKLHIKLIHKYIMILSSENTFVDINRTRKIGQCVESFIIVDVQRVSVFRQAVV